ncbi:MAG TPA: TolC family protein, partial [Acidobacteriaceae bacterium]|nr:TolC family protein [Acidobacteriaceae bacterium]
MSNSRKNDRLKKHGRRRESLGAHAGVRLWLTLGLGCAALSCCPMLHAQISLSTVVDLAQRNSTQVRAAQADLEKAANTLKETKDVYIPNLILGSSVGPPSIGFTFSQPSIASASMQSLAYSKSQGKYIDAAKAGVEAAVL